MGDWWVASWRSKGHPEDPTGSLRRLRRKFSMQHVDSSSNLLCSGSVTVLHPGCIPGKLSRLVSTTLTRRQDPFLYQCGSLRTQPFGFWSEMIRHSNAPEPYSSCRIPSCCTEGKPVSCCWDPPCRPSGIPQIARQHPIRKNLTLEAVVRLTSLGALRLL